jgi:hypothetical protein
MKKGGSRSLPSSNTGWYSHYKKRIKREVFLSANIGQTNAACFLSGVMGE